MIAPFIKFYGKIWWSGCFYATITGNSERFQYFNFEANFEANGVKWKFSFSLWNFPTWDKRYNKTKNIL